ncbi:MAG: hypothetical protein AAFX06_15715 [Planctomycetota bacterium]
MTHLNTASRHLLRDGLRASFVFVVFVVSGHAFGQTPIVTGSSSNAASDSPLVPVKMTLLKLRIVEDKLVYPGKIFVPNPGEVPEKVTVAEPQTYTVQVPYVVTVNGQPVTRMRSETRTRMVSTVKVKGGKYEPKEIALDADAVFLSLDGEEVDRKQVLERTSTSELVVPVIFRGQPIPDLWKGLLKKNTLILETATPIQVEVGP